MWAFTRLKALALLPLFTRKQSLGNGTSERGGGGSPWVLCAGRFYAGCGFVLNKRPSASSPAGRPFFFSRQRPLLLAEEESDLF